MPVYKHLLIDYLSSIQPPLSVDEKPADKHTRFFPFHVLQFLNNEKLQLKNTVQINFNSFLPPILSLHYNHNRNAV